MRSSVTRGAALALACIALCTTAVADPRNSLASCAGFEAAEPDLEDVYFAAMAGRIGRRSEQPEAAVTA